MALLIVVGGVALHTAGLDVAILLFIGNVVLVGYVVVDLGRLRGALPLASTIADIGTDQSLATSLRQITEACSITSKIQDGLHREMTFACIQQAADGISTAAAGIFQFESTEQWRAYYERLLTSHGLHVYRSVAIVRKPSYWQTEAGIKGIQLNHQLSESKRLTIERVVVLTNDLWPDRNALPVDRIQEWLIEQHHHGISLWLVRESELSGEADLLVDMGIYGSRAVGVQELDDHGNTRRFTLQFGIEHVQQAEERWQRLLVYAVKYSDFLDRYTITS